jgi:vacuolar-type H+-ATPase subunit I/STV1
MDETQEFEILGDPRSPAAQADYQLQFDFLQDVVDKLTETHQAIIDIRSLRDQIQEIMAKYPDLENLSTEGKAIIAELNLIEQKLYQTKNQSNQDPLNYPIQ